MKGPDLREGSFGPCPIPWLTLSGGVKFGQRTSTPTLGLLGNAVVSQLGRQLLPAPRPLHLTSGGPGSPLGALQRLRGHLASLGIQAPESWREEWSYPREEEAWRSQTCVNSFNQQILLKLALHGRHQTHSKEQKKKKQIISAPMSQI